jgi:hypothetical protein
LLKFIYSSLFQTTSVQKKSRGRPKGSFTLKKKEDDEETEHEEKGQKDEIDLTQDYNIKEKEKDEWGESEREEESEYEKEQEKEKEQEIPPKKRRGRPPKHPNDPKKSRIEKEGDKQPKKRGRPPLKKKEENVPKPTKHSSKKEESESELSLGSVKNDEKKEKSKTRKEKKTKEIHLFDTNIILDYCETKLHPSFIPLVGQFGITRSVLLQTEQSFGLKKWKQFKITNPGAEFFDLHSDDITVPSLVQMFHKLYPYIFPTNKKVPSPGFHDLDIETYDMRRNDMFIWFESHAISVQANARVILHTRDRNWRSFTLENEHVRDLITAKFPNSDVTIRIH